MVRTMPKVYGEVKIISLYIIYDFHDEGKVNELSIVVQAGIILVLCVGERFRLAFPNAAL